jgi:hypothetical protein
MPTAKICLTASLLFSLLIGAQAQNNAGVIKGTLKDSSNKQVLALATVTVFLAKDTSIITYRLSDPSGNFRIPGLPLDVSCRVLISYSGYRVVRKEFLLNKENNQLDLGTIFLVNDPKSLDEVIVLAERPPVSVRKDTIEFNASAFKTLPSALVEDLLKKLPGIDVDQEGNITVKGKTVNKLLVDGKEFFGGDPKIATKNLPANIVDKVQVMNDKEELERNPDIPESEIGQVINIKLKRAIKQGWFGKAYAGAGTDNRHEVGAIVNIFRDTTQVSVLGYSNNINKPGFGISDVQKIGGFQRSGYSSMMVMSDGGFALNGVSFGGTGQGLQRSTGGGINFNNQFGKKVTLNLQYFYGQINSEFNTISHQQRFFKDTILSTFSTSNSESVSINHRIGGTVIWKIDSFTTLNIRPGITLSNNRNFRQGETGTEENYRGRINSSTSTNRGNGKTENFSHNIFLTRTFRKRGRMFTVSSDFSSMDNDNDNYNDGLFVFYEAGLPDDSLVNQLRRTGGNNTRSSTNFSFSEPLSKKLTLRLSHISEFLKEDNTTDFFSKDVISGKYDQFNQTFSNGIQREGWKNTSSVSVNFRHKKLSLNPGINFLAASFNNYYTKNPKVAQRFDYLYPSLSINLGSFSLGYRAYIQEPRANDLQPVIDISNRFYQQFGNPDLKPSFTHNININAYKFNPKTGNSYSVYVNGGFVDNAAARETTIDRNGVQSSRPINVDGIYNFSGSLNYNYQYKLNKSFRLSVRPSLYGSFNKNFISVNRNFSEQDNLSVYSSVLLGLNYMDKIELNQVYRHNYRQTTYEKVGAYKDLYVLSHTLESEVVIRMPKHVVWENLINYNYNPQVGPGIRKSSVRWNAGVSYLFLKEEKGQLKLSVYDLLKQNINVYRNTGENYISDVQNTTLTRYFMLSFIYNLRTFSGGKVGGKERGMFFF